MLIITEYLQGIYQSDDDNSSRSSRKESRKGQDAVSGLMFAVYFMQISETLHTLRHR